MAPREWDFSAAIEELKKGDLRRKHGPIELLVPPAKIRSDLRRVAECYFDNKKSWGLAPTKVKAKYGQLLDDLDRVGDPDRPRTLLIEILQNPSLLRPLIISDNDYQGTSYGWQRLLGTFDRSRDKIHDRVKAADRVAASRVRGGRPRSPHRSFLFISLCGLYEKYTGALPGRTGEDGAGCVDGPFVRFVVAVFREIEPEEAQNAKLMSAISNAVTKWKGAKGRKGKKYDYGFNR